MSDWESQVRGLQDEGRRAFLAQDIGRLEQLWSEDLVVNSPIHQIHDRSQVLGLLRKGVIRHLSYDEEVERVARFGDVVVIMGRDVVVNAPDAPPLRRRFTNVWRESGDTWRLVARHTHVIPEG